MAERIIAADAALGEAVVTGSRSVADRMFLLEMAVEGEMAELAPIPGRFYQVRCGAGREHMLRRPLSPLGFTPGARPGAPASLRFLVDVVGWGTAWLSDLRAGAKVSLLGPLGHGFDPPGFGEALLVGGGVGVAPLCHLASEMERAGRGYRLVAGFSDAARVPRDVLPPGAAVYTEDGSLGEKGTALDGVGPAIGRGCAGVFTCGPEELMSRVASMCAEHGLPCQISLDERLACGIGACRGCVKEGPGGNVCVCLDGPVQHWGQTP